MIYEKITLRKSTLVAVRSNIGFFFGRERLSLLISLDHFIVKNFPDLNAKCIGNAECELQRGGILTGLNCHNRYYGIDGAFI